MWGRLKELALSTHPPLPHSSELALILESSRVMGICTYHDGICHVMSPKGALGQPQSLPSPALEVVVVLGSCSGY